MKKLISIILLLSMVFFLVSCNRNQGDPDDEVFPPSVTVGKDFAVYENMVFYRDNMKRDLKYQYLDNPQSTGFPLYQDSLSVTEKNPFANTGPYAIFLVDPIATKKNDGNPVLYIAPDHSQKQLISFNTATNQVKILKSDLSRVLDLLLYGEYLIFSTSEGDLGTRIHSIKTDGTEYRTLENPDKLRLTIKNAIDGEVYFTSGEGNLYKAPLSLESFSLVLNDCYTPVFFCGDYLYYNELSTKHLCRVLRNNLSVKETVIDREVAGITQDSLYLYVMTDDRDTVYLYNAETNENKVVYQKSGTLAYKRFSEDYIYFRGFDENNKSFIVYYDIAKKEEIRIPY